jgi:hypothetical protein
MLYEYRKYTAAPGKLPAVHERFEKSVLGLFDRHGMQVVGFWTPVVGATISELHYILKWDSAEQMQSSWGAFVSDPEWARVAAESERDGVLVASVDTQLWASTSYSPGP